MYEIGQIVDFFIYTCTCSTYDIHVTLLTPETTMLLSDVYDAEFLSSRAGLHVSLVIVNRPGRETVTAG